MFYVVPTKCDVSISLIDGIVIVVCKENRYTHDVKNICHLEVRALQERGCNIKEETSVK